MRISILYDSAEDQEKQAAAERGEELVLVSEEIGAALQAKGHEVRRLAAVGSALELARQIAEDDSDLIFNNCESFGGQGDQEQNVAALLELFGKRFTGSGSIGLALAQDKALAKMLLGFHDIETPKFAVLEHGEAGHIDEFDFPMIVKPATSDSSIGIDEGSIVHNVKELLERTSYIEREFDAPALIEEFIDGRELYVGVLGGERPEALPVLEWDLSALPGDGPKIATQEAKFDKNNPAYQNPLQVPDLAEPVLVKIQDAALQAFRALKLRDYGRVDMRLRRRDEGGEDDPESWEVFIIEVNPNPHLAQDSELTVGYSKQGNGFEDLIGRIVDNALSRPVR